MTVEVRFSEEGGIDEIVTGKDAQVHLERLNDAIWSLIIETPHSHGHFNFSKKGREIIVTVYEIDMTKGYTAEAATKPHP